MTETPRHGHAPIKMNLVENEDDVEALGDYWLDEAGDIWLVIPSPDKSGRFGRHGGTMIHLPLCQGEKKPTAWLWDGNRSKPTITPSVHTHGHWHGWVRQGQLIEV